MTTNKTPHTWRPLQDAVYIIAEAGVNHNGDLQMAKELIDAAVTAQANAVKFQTFKAEKLASPKAQKADYQLQTTDQAESQFDMLKSLELPPEAYQELMAYCQSKQIDFISTPFDEESADFLENLGMSLFKIPSGEITNLPFLNHVAAKQKPMIVSTGMASLGEVETAKQEIYGQGNQQLAFLHCTTNYPAAINEVNLRAMVTMEQALQVSSGYSDHTEGIEVSLAAVALGACIVEKHFTLSRTLPGPDHKASLEPPELIALVKGIRNVEQALGHGRKEPAPSEARSLETIRKSLVAAHDIPALTVLSKSDIAIVRPGTGLQPAFQSFLIGRSVTCDIPAGTLFSLEMLA